MAERVRVRRLTDQEGQKLQRLVRRGASSPIRLRRATIVLASAGGNTVPAIARLVEADEDTVGDVIHAFNREGLRCLVPRWAGGRPRLLTPETEDLVVRIARTRPARLGMPFTCWSIRKLAAYLAERPDGAIVVGRERLRVLLARRGISFQHTKTWKESPDPDREAKLAAIEDALEHHLGQVYAFDEFGPLGIRPTSRDVLGTGGQAAAATCHLPPATAPRA